MFCEWFLKHVWYFISKQGLIDEQDVFLLEESFSETTKCPNWFTFELTAFIIPLTSFLVICGISLNTILIASTFVLLAFLIFYTIPQVICCLLTTNVDERLRNFLAGLRQKEFCLFSLQRPSYCSKSIGFLLPLRRSRLSCLKQLRKFIQNYNLASKQFIITNTDKENLLFNFIGEEMYNLVCSNEQESVKGMEEKLKTSALKTLWQFMFLVRSEFLRLSILKLQHDICYFHPIGFIQHFFIFLRTILATSSLNINTNFWEPNKTKSFNKSTQINITQFKICRAHLEWTLERLELLDEKSASLSCEEKTLFRRGIVGCLEQIIQRLNDDDNIGKSKISSIENCGQLELENYEGIVKMDSSAEQMKGRNVDDLKIYEADLVNQQSDPVMENEEGDEKSKMETAHPSLFCTFGAHNAVQNELRHVLCQRKDYCLQRELTALARLRGISPNEIAKEELDRTPFSTFTSNKSHWTTQNEMHPPPLNHGLFGQASLNSVDLNSILKQRRTIFGTDDEKTPQPQNRDHHHRIMQMEAYGEK